MLKARPRAFDALATVVRLLQRLPDLVGGHLDDEDSLAVRVPLRKTEVGQPVKRLLAGAFGQPNLFRHHGERQVVEPDHVG
jgi:hypothetical protein